MERKQQRKDCWILQTPIRVPPDSDFYFGKPGCDNRIAYEFHNMNYDLINCPYDIKIYHLHQSDIRNYTNKDRLSGKYLLLNVCRLDEIANNYKNYYHFLH